MLILKYIYQIIVSFIGHFKHIRITVNSRISPKVIKNRFVNFHSSRNFPILINNSFVGDMEIGEGSKIVNASCTSNVIIGRLVSINGPGTRVSALKNRILIGDFTSIASNVIIQEYNHRINRISTSFIKNKLYGKDIVDEVFSKGDIIIEEDVWIGSNVSILSGVFIGRGSIIGAGSVITKNIPPYSIVVGNPARVIRSRFDSETINLLEESRWWEYDLSELKKFEKLYDLDLNFKDNFEKLKLILEKLKDTSH